MKKYKILLIFILFSISNSFGYNFLKTNDHIKPILKWGEFLERPSPWSYGGVFGMYFRQNGFDFHVQPMLSFRASDRIFLGVSTAINYSLQKNYLQYFNSNTSTYQKADLNGTFYDYSIFSRWFVAGLTFLQIEPGYVNFKEITNYHFDAGLDKLVIESTRKNIPYIQMGAGFVVPFGNEKFFIIRCMYDVLQNKESPYYKLPIIRGGVNIGI